MTEETGATVTTPREVGASRLTGTGCVPRLMASAVTCDVDHQRGHTHTHEDIMAGSRDDKELATDLEEVRTKL